MVRTTMTAGAGGVDALCPWCGDPAGARWLAPQLWQVIEDPACVGRDVWWCAGCGQEWVIEIADPVVATCQECGAFWSDWRQWYDDVHRHRHLGDQA